MPTPSPPTLDSLLEDLRFLDDWDDRYRYLIDLGKTLPKLDEAAYSDENKVRGCASQVWLTFARDADGRFRLGGDSDALIVKGLVALVLAIFDGKRPEEIAVLDEQAIFRSIGLNDHLTAQRSNGLASMIARIRADAGR